MTKPPKPFKRTFAQVKDISRRVDREGFCSSEASPFAVFRDETRGWVLCQWRSGLSIMALVPRNVPKTRVGLLNFAIAMETANPEACEIVGNLSSLPWPEEAKPFGRELIEWARDYTP